MRPRPDQPILLVEDDPDDRFLLERALRQAAVQAPVQACEDGRCAVDYLSGAGGFADRAAHPLPFLALVDIKMPLMDGFELLGWIRRQPQVGRLPVVMFSSSLHPGDCLKAYASQANAFVVKPATLDGLVSFAAALKVFWLDRVEFPPLG